MFYFSIILNDEKDLINFGIVLSKVIFSNSVIFFSGGLGIGKTTLAKSVICNLLDYTLNVKSPTYTLVETYFFLNKIVYHFDLYRLFRLSDLFDIDFKNYLVEYSVCIIEWGDIFYTVIFPHISVYFFSYSKCNRILILKSKFLNFDKLFG